MTYFNTSEKHGCPGYKNYAVSYSTNLSLNSVAFFVSWDDMENSGGGELLDSPL